MSGGRITGKDREKIIEDVFEGLNTREVGCA